MLGVSGLVEPSDAERRDWPEATFDYVSGLEDRCDALLAALVLAERELSFCVDTMKRGGGAYEVARDAARSAIAAAQAA